MAESFVQRWPETARLAVYAEDFTPDVDGIEVRQLPAWMDEFKSIYGKVPGYNGQYKGRYDYRFDAVKFAHKAAALTDFGVSVSDGIMIWLDADTYTHAPIDDAWLESLMPAKAYIAWLERRGSHPETGFVMFRASYPFHKFLIEAMRNLYTSGDLFKLAETHDAAALHHVVMSKAAQGKIPPPFNLSGDCTNWHHPFVAGKLGEKMDHMKGPRKTEGTSRRRDLKAPRPEAYWTKVR